MYSETIICNFLTIIQIIFVVYACSFDETVEKTLNIPKVFVNYRSARSKRDTNHLPMRFNIYVEKTENANFKILEAILKKATARVSQLLHVIPVHGHLHLERTSCGSIWSHGPNRGRCSSIRPKYKGEICENKIDGFTIPEKHLDRLDIYGFTGENPKYSISAGVGAVAADYILYVKSQFTTWCQKEDVQAYASYCRLDQHGRPIAGYINFCPNSLNQGWYKPDDILKVAIHEIFHAVGFSKDLFSEYRGCPLDEVDCEIPKNLIIKDSYNVLRLNLPSVNQQAMMHFGCQNSEFGAPLEIVNGSYTSHWNSLLLYGSIMTPTMHNSYISLIDPITLSVFADTGWYHVDFSKADHYTWGKEEGCNFGLTNQCDSKEDLCSVTENDNTLDGCDFLHNTRARCQKLNSDHYCGVYKPNVNNDCQKQELIIEGKRLHRVKCFVAETQEKVHSMCTAYSCKTSGELDILINETTWISCPYRTTVKVDDMLLICPKNDVFCHGDYESGTHELNSAQQFSTSLIMVIVFTVIAGIWILVSGMVLGISLVNVMKLHR